MADAQIQPLGTADAPSDWTLASAQEVVFRSLHAVFDGASAAVPFVPAVQIVGPGGVVAATFPLGQPIAAGGSAEVTWFPGVNDTVRTLTVMPTIAVRVPLTGFTLNNGVTLTFAFTELSQGIGGTTWPFDSNAYTLTPNPPPAAGPWVNIQVNQPGMYLLWGWCTWTYSWGPGRLRYTLAGAASGFLGSGLQVLTASYPVFASSLALQVLVPVYIDAASLPAQIGLQVTNLTGSNQTWSVGSDRAELYLFQISSETS